LIGLTGFGVVYGSVGRLDSSISASGRLQPVGGSFEVLPPFSAPIRRVLVRDGQLVSAGQPLLELDVEEARRQRLELRALADLWWKEANRAALQLNRPAVPPVGEEQRQALADQQRDTALRRQAAQERLLRSGATLRQQRSDLEALLRKQTINRRIQGRMERLVQQGAISRLELDRQEERSVELDGMIQRTVQQLEAARRDVGESAANLDQVGSSNRRQLSAQYDEARRQLLELNTRLDQLESRIRLSRLVAPVEGQVFDLKAKAGELAAGPYLLRLVPQRGLEARLAISNQDIGLLRPGMAVEVRVTSFPFSEYGSLRGQLTRVGADALTGERNASQEVFPAIVRLDRESLDRRGKRYSLRSGMAVTGLIQTGSRPLLALMNDRIGSFLESLRTIR
jgi:HlyD family secretion protein